MRPADRVIARAHPKIEETSHLSATTVQRRDLLLTLVADASMALATVVLLVMVFAIAVLPI